MSIVYSNNFDAETTGALPTGWVNSVGTWQVTTINPVSGTKALYSSTNGDGNVALYTGAAAIADMTVSIRQIAVASATHMCVMGLVLRSDATNQNSYTVVFGPTSATGCTIAIYKKVAGAYTLVSSTAIAYTVAAGNTFYIQASAVGSLISVWLGVGSLPGTASVTATDTSVTAAGYAGLYNDLDTTTTVMSADDFVLSNNASSLVVPVTSPALLFSPYNWFSDGTGALAGNNVNASSTFAQSNNPGAYLKFNVTIVTAGNIALNLDNSPLAGVSAGDFPQISVFVDALAPVVTQLAGTTTQAIVLAASLAAGTHSIVVVFKAIGAATSDRWTTPALSIKVTNVSAPSDATFAAATRRTGNIIIFGDSITEGKHNLGTTQLPADTDAGYCWTHFLAAAMDCEVGVVGFGGTGFANTGPNNLPTLSGSYNLYSAARSRLVSTQFAPVPDRVFVASGENDSTGGTLATTITSTLASIRAATVAPITVIVPFTGKCRSDILAATLPALTSVVDVDSGVGDGSHLLYYPSNQSPPHPTIAGSAYLAPRIEKIMRSGISKTARTVTLTLTSDGTAPRANLTGLTWAFFDQVKPGLFSTPADFGSNATTNASGVLSVTVRTSLASGATGWFVVTDTDGTTTQSPVAKAFAAPAVVV